MWESTVFETLRVLSVLLITVSTRTPVAQSTHSCTARVFQTGSSHLWHSRWTSSSDARLRNGQHLPSWLTWTHVALSATFTAVCVTRSTWKGSSHLFWSPALSPVITNITTKSPGLTSCRNLSATFPWAAFTCTEIFDNRQDILCSNSTCHSSHTSVDGSLCLPPPYAHEWWPANKISNGLRCLFLLFFFLILMYISTIGRALSQVRPVSSQHFANLFLIVWFCLSTAPPDEGA